MAYQKVKTEHNGAKNGGGFWGTRAEAKKISRKLRRKFGHLAIKEQSSGQGENG